VTIGSTTISATVGAIVGSTPLAVTPPVLQSITVTGGGAMDIHYGFMAQFSATGHYSDGSTPNITTMVTWASSNPSVVTIDPTGLAYGASLGTSTISATLGTIVGTQSVSVIP
jgi:hypothetical protein